MTAPKDVVRRFLDEAWTKDGWDMAVIDELFSEAYFSHTWGGDLATTGGRQARFFSGLELLERLSSDLVAEDDLVVHRATQRYRHVGDVMGVPATEREVTVEHVEMWRVTDGKIVEHWGGIGAGAQLHRALTVG